MKKIIAFIIFLSLFDIQAKEKQKQEANQPQEDAQMILIGGYDDSDYQEEKPVKKTQEKKTQPVNTAEKKQAEKNINKEMPIQEPKKQEEISKEKKSETPAPKGYKKHSFETFFVDFPLKCEVKKEDKDLASIGENKDCKFKGKMGAFKNKLPTQNLVDAYKTKCQKENKKLLYRRWLQSENLEGYISVCEGEKGSSVSMEANSNISDKSYQFIGEIKDKFNQDIKAELYISFKSISEK